MKLTNKEVQEIVARADDEYDRLKDRVHEQYDEIKRLNNIIENFEEELEREINIKEEDTGLEHDRYLLIKDTLETMLRRFINIKGVDKE